MVDYLIGAGIALAGLAAVVTAAVVALVGLAISRAAELDQAEQVRWDVQQAADAFEAYTLGGTR